jgi:hypothetical protein
MLKALRYVLALVLVIGSILILSTSSSFRSCIEKQTAAKSQQAKESFPKLTLTIADRAAICARCAGHLVYEYRDAATAVATIFIAIFTFTLWRSTSNLWLSGERHSERELRAYVYPSVKRIKTFSLTEPIVIIVELRNAGQTPASECETSSSVFVGALPLQDDAKMEGVPAEPEDIGRHSMQTIYPQGEYSFDCVSIDLLTPGIVAELQKGTAAVYVAGESIYKDVFGIKRSSQFCFYIDPDHLGRLIEDEQGKQITMPPPSVINFVTAHVWNQTT